MQFLIEVSSCLETYVNGGHCSASSLALIAAVAWVQVDVGTQKMLHITAQMQSSQWKQDIRPSRKSADCVRTSASTSDQPGTLRSTSTRSVIGTSEFCEEPEHIRKSSRKRKVNILLTPSSAASPIFDSPLKPSLSSSPSSLESFTNGKRSDTPLAELEDTSQCNVLSELEDTSDVAVYAIKRTIKASYILKSKHPNVSHVASLMQSLMGPAPYMNPSFRTTASLITL